MNRCKYCGKPLTLTPEYDTCIECQGRIMREATMPQGGIATNSTQPSMNIYDEEITHEEARKHFETMQELILVTFNLGCMDEDLTIINRYITQQQAKEERAKRVEELKDLFIELANINYLMSQTNNSDYYIDKRSILLRQIKIKEKELEELK